MWIVCTVQNRITSHTNPNGNQASFIPDIYLIQQQQHDANIVCDHFSVFDSDKKWQSSKIQNNKIQIDSNHRPTLSIGTKHASTFIIVWVFYCGLYLLCALFEIGSYFKFCWMRDCAIEIWIWIALKRCELSVWHGHTAARKSSFPVHCLSDAYCWDLFIKWKKENIPLFHILSFEFFFFYVTTMFAPYISMFVCKQIGKYIAYR